MTSLKPSQIAKLHDRLLFEEIHHLKSYFIRLFSDLANEISLDYLQVLHPQSQGIKISKGNELQHCPYQVLDLIRDFDKHMGLNIRVMNWWGRGLFIFVFLGGNHAKANPQGAFVSTLSSLGYSLTKTASPWDYTRIIDLDQKEKIFGVETLNIHLSRFHYMQFVKHLEYEHDLQAQKETLKQQLTYLLK